MPLQRTIPVAVSSQVAQGDNTMGRAETSLPSVQAGTWHLPHNAAVTDASEDLWAAFPYKEMETKGGKKKIKEKCFIYVFIYLAWEGFF